MRLLGGAGSCDCGSVVRMGLYGVSSHGLGVRSISTLHFRPIVSALQMRQLVLDTRSVRRILQLVLNRRGRPVTAQGIVSPLSLNASPRLPDIFDDHASRTSPRLLSIHVFFSHVPFHRLSATPLGPPGHDVVSRRKACASA